MTKKEQNLQKHLIGATITEVIMNDHVITLVLNTRDRLVIDRGVLETNLGYKNCKHYTYTIDPLAK
jgi:hypothetical protein